MRVRHLGLGPRMGPRRLHRHHVSIGRGDKIRTCDPLHPMQVRYQAAPRPDRMRMIAQTGFDSLKAESPPTAAKS